MAELLEEQRESWGTRGGFILAAVGSAVGLGNLWGFPYKLYSYFVRQLNTIVPSWPGFPDISEYRDGPAYSQ